MTPPTIRPETPKPVKRPWSVRVTWASTDLEMFVRLVTYRYPTEEDARRFLNQQKSIVKGGDLLLDLYENEDTLHDSLFISATAVETLTRLKLRDIKRAALKEQL